MVESVFAVVAMCGLLAGLRPELFARYFFTGWKRQRIEAHLGGLSSVGWLIFIFSGFTFIVALIADVMSR